MKKRGGKDMAGKVNWESSWDAALLRAKKEDRPILLDFFNPG